MGLGIKNLDFFLLLIKNSSIAINFFLQVEDGYIMWIISKTKVRIEKIT